jgi:hypothetical protein
MFVNGVTRGNVGPWSPNQVRTIADTINRINGEGQRGPKSAPPPVVVFMARITGSTAISGKTATIGGTAAQPVAWEYDWEEVSVSTTGTYNTSDTYRRKSSLIATKGKAINGCEGPQIIGATTTLGPGITTSNIPAGFSFKAIANNTVVMMYATARATGENLFFFSMPNAVDGACA